MSANFRGNEASPSNDSWCQKTRVPGLSLGVVCVILRLVVLIQYPHVTDRRTDRHMMTAMVPRWHSVARVTKSNCFIFRTTVQHTEHVYVHKIEVKLCVVK